MKSLQFFLISLAIGLSTQVSAQSWMTHLSHSFEIDGRNLAASHDKGIVSCGYVKDLTDHDYMFVCKQDSSGNIVWQYSYEGMDDVHARAIQKLADNGFLIQGHLGSDWIIIRLDSAGQLVWARKLGGPGSQTAHNYSKALETSEGHIVLTVYNAPSSGLTYHSVVVRLDPNGNVIWKKRIGHSFYQSYFHSAMDAGRGEIYLYGWIWPVTEWNIQIAKIDSQGNFLLHRHCWRSGATARETLVEVKPGPDKSLYLAGSARYFGWDYGWGFLSQLDSNLSPVWSKKYGTYSTSTGFQDFLLDGKEIIAVGGTNQIGNGSGDALFMRTDSIGNPYWNQVYGTTGGEGFKIIEPKDNNSYWIAGNFEDASTGTRALTTSLLHENQLLCISGSGQLTVDTLIWGSNSVSHTVLNATNPVDSYNLTQGAISLNSLDPCQALNAAEFYLEGWEENGIAQFESYHSEPGGTYELQRSIDQQNWTAVQSGEWPENQSNLQLTDATASGGIQLYRLQYISPLGWTQISNQVEISLPYSQQFRIFHTERGPVLDVLLDQRRSLAWKVIDVKGRIIAHRNEGQLLAGAHQIPIHLRELTQGVYFLQILEHNRPLVSLKWMARR